MGFTVQHTAYIQLGHDGTFCDVTGPMWYVYLPLARCYLLIVYFYVTDRPKLFGYGAVPLIFASAGAIYTALSISRLKKIIGVKNVLQSRLKMETRSQVLINISFSRSFSRPMSSSARKHNSSCKTVQSTPYLRSIPKRSIISGVRFVIVWFILHSLHA